MSEELEKLIVVLDAQTQLMERNLRKAARLTDAKLDKIDKRVTRSDKRFAKWGKNMRVAIAAGLTYAVVQSGKAALKAADEMQIMQDRIKDATKESGGFDAAWKGITETAIGTGSELQNNVELFQRLSIASEDLGATNEKILRLNETVQKLGIISGASGSAMAAGTTQLAQGLGNSILRAEEFNSIVENIPAVANQIAKSLGKSTPELRNMVLEGKVLSKDVFDALLQASEEVDERFNAIPPRLSRSWAGFLTVLKLNIAEVNEELGVTEGLASALDELTKAQAHMLGSIKEGQSPLDAVIDGWRVMLGFVEENETVQERLLLLGEQRAKLEQEIAWYSGKIDEYSKAAAREREAELKQINLQVAALEKRNKLINKPSSGDATTTPPAVTPDPRATPDYIQPTLKNLNKDRPDNPFVVATDRSKEINATISERTALIALEGSQVGRTTAEIERMNLEFEINKQLSEDRIQLTNEQRSAMEMQLDMFQRELEMTAAANAQYDEMQDRMRELDRIADQFAQDFGDIFIESLQNGENAITNLKDAFKNALIKMAADALIINPMKNLFASLGGAMGGGGGFFGFLGKALGGMFGGFRAAGGDVAGNKSYLVGENGPEIYSPKSAGRISPNRILGGGDTHITVNVDARGSSNPDEMRQVAQAAVLESAGAIISASEQRVISNSRRPKVV